MRVAGNKLRHIAGFFRSELAGIYPAPEVEAMLASAIASVLGFSKTELLQKQEENINQSDLLKLYDCAKALKKNIPLQYIIGETWFYKLRFRVNKHVLIPRPETEELADLILKEHKIPVSILDIGTGSGCIPVALKKNLPEAEVSACDISPEALKLARENAQLNAADITFFEADILKTEQVLDKNGKPFGLIVSNPPYIKESEKESMEKNVLDHEPHLALFVAGDDAILFYRRIIDLCAGSLAKTGKLYFELNPLTAKAVEDHAKKTGMFESTALLKDMSGTIRFFRAVKN